MLTERWKPVPGYEGRYDVSDWGRVRSINSQGRAPVVVLRPRIKDGYHNVRLYKDRRQSQRGIHQLVLLAFVGPDPNPLRNEGNHRDGDKANNTLDNLEWSTRRENYDHAVRTGLKPVFGPELARGHMPFGENSGVSIFINEEVREIKLWLSQKRTVSWIARQKRCARGTINAIKFGKTWRHIL